jgi:hypothetical protein
MINRRRSRKFHFNAGNQTKAVERYTKPKRERRRTLKSPDSSTAFRLPKILLSTIDAVCDREDLTRSQVYRKSLTEFLRRHNVDIKMERTSAEPHSGFFEAWQEGANEGGT